MTWTESGFYKAFVKTVTDKKYPSSSYTNKANQRTLEDVQKYDGFCGLLVDEAVLLDPDEEIHSNNLMAIIEGEQLHCMTSTREGGRGIHALFFNDGIKTGATNVMLACGVIVDIKLGCKNGLDCLKYQGVERVQNYNEPPYQTIPKYMLPLKNCKIDFANMGEGDGRNDTLYSYILTLQGNDFSVEEIKECVTIINKYVLKEPVSDNELDVILRDEAFKKKSFFKGSTFLHDRFAEHIKRTHHIIRNDGNILIYKEGVYEYSLRDIEQAMVKEIPSLKTAQRKEVLNHLNLICDDVDSSSTNLIAFRNGVLNIESGELLPFSVEHIISNKIPWDYNAQAYDELADTTLNNIACNDPEIRMLLEEMVGSCFYRSNTLGGGRAFILTGEGANGKSTFIAVLNKILGIDNISALEMKNLDAKFSTVRMYKKLANIGDDISDEFNSDVSTFKKIVTGDRIEAQEKGQPTFEFNPYCKLIFSANVIPRIRDKTGAAQRRMIIIPFNAKFVDTDKDFDPQITWKLKQQISIEYLIKIGIEGLKRVLHNKKFTSSAKVQKELDDYAVRNNPVLSFIKDCDDEEIGIINEPIDEVFSNYQGFCIKNGYNALAKNEFSKQIQRLLHISTNRKRINGSKNKVSIFVEDGQA